MRNGTRDLLEEALRLPPDERASLASQLLRSLDDDEGEALAPEEWQRLWTAEVERRLRDVREGKVELIEGDAVFRELRAGRKSGR
ncbi:MAG: addiction module protein [Deltaproteobacteria bacterium]|nr:addiction module protein [Deltaproteobacteria bacterium]